MANPKVITAPTTEPITRAEAKLHLRLDDVGGVHPDDSLIDGLIVGAREYAQHYCGQSFGAQVRELALPEFPSDDWIELPYGPVTAITTVTYVDTAGDTQTWGSSNYVLDDYSLVARLVLAYGISWPSTRCQANAVKVRYAAGVDEIPEAVRSAMLMHIDLHYAGNDYTDAQQAATQKAIDSLLGTVKVWGA